MRTMLDALVTGEALKLIHQCRNADAIDHFPSLQVGTRNVCAKVHPELADDIDQVCGLLGISKRRWLEAAFVEALDKTKAILQAEGVWEELGNRQPVTEPENVDLGGDAA
ncbi:MAG: hypothetical protein AW09_003955 [Candidatus Accumulibacter phosphatis]|uniref:Uncharacterized protein n=1 Tax=Candidatus Accumulibacter phosphatis TaxID=327160 RepID=A0A080LTK3_9PROT|nr:MAG: hypothetical protein AW09_003955 [Candidatus Accumulibacter phosphatis]